MAKFTHDVFHPDCRLKIPSLAASKISTIFSTCSGSLNTRRAAREAFLPSDAEVIAVAAGGFTHLLEHSLVVGRELQLIVFVERGGLGRLAVIQ